MLLYDSIGPNPRMVRMFAAEKGIALERKTIDLRGGENRREPYLSKNPAGQLPALELDDGSVITEITAICEYLDELKPEPALIGHSPRERAETRMWTRRIDLNIAEPIGQGYRYAEGLKLFTGRIHLIPQAAADLKAIAQERLAWLDGLIGGRTFICGDRFTMADIMLFIFVDFGVLVGQALNPAFANVAAHYERMKARESAKA